MNSDSKFMAGALASIASAMLLYGCSSGKADAGHGGEGAPTPLPVLTLQSIPATTYREYTAAVEGKVNVEIRPQVDGILDKIYVDEGDYVKQGQPLFKVNDRLYQEQLSNNRGALEAARANQEKAAIEVEKLTPLVENNVVSDVQLKNAKASFAAAKATVAQAQAMVSNAGINVGYTLITAPVSGYVGRIPLKSGSLVGRGEAQPLTVLSDVKDVYAYFSMSEVDFIQFKNEMEGGSVQEKIKHFPQVELMLADGSIYESKGRIETVEGQFDKTTGAISFRATFPNAAGVLRSGSTGKVRIPKQHENTLVVPHEATFELQDKVFVFIVGDSNKVSSKPIHISGKSNNYLFVDKGVKAGDKIVYTGLDRLREGAVVAPQPLSIDSLLKSKPL